MSETEGASTGVPGREIADRVVHVTRRLALLALSTAPDTDGYVRTARAGNRLVALTEALFEAPASGELSADDRGAIEAGLAEIDAALARYEVLALLGIDRAGRIDEVSLQDQLFEMEPAKLRTAMVSLTTGLEGTTLDRIAIFSALPVELFGVGGDVLPKIKVFLLIIIDILKQYYGEKYADVLKHISQLLGEIDDAQGGGAGGATPTDQPTGDPCCVTVTLSGISSTNNSFKGKYTLNIRVEGADVATYTGAFKPSGSGPASFDGVTYPAILDTIELAGCNRLTRINIQAEGSAETSKVPSQTPRSFTSMCPPAAKHRDVMIPLVIPGTSTDPAINVQFKFGIDWKCCG